MYKLMFCWHFADLWFDRSHRCGNWGLGRSGTDLYLW